MSFLAKEPQSPSPSVYVSAVAPSTDGSEGRQEREEGTSQVHGSLPAIHWHTSLPIPNVASRCMGNPQIGRDTLSPWEFRPEAAIVAVNSHSKMPLQVQVPGLTWRRQVYSIKNEYENKPTVCEQAT